MILNQLNCQGTFTDTTSCGQIMDKKDERKGFKGKRRIKDKCKLNIAIRLIG